MLRHRWRLGQLFAFAFGVRPEQFNGSPDFGGVEDRLAIPGPDGQVAAAAMKVGHVEKLNDAFVTGPAHQLLEASAVGAYDVRMAIVMLPGEKHHPGSVRRPLRREIERLPG